MSGLDDFYGPNAGYVAELLDRLQADPGALNADTRRALAETTSTPQPVLAGTSAPLGEGQISAAASAAELAQRIRFFGHLAAHIDPLGSPPPGDPQLDAASYGLTDGDLHRLPAAVVGGPVVTGSRDAAQAIEELNTIYRGTSGYEFAQVQAADERAWLLEAVEDRRFWPPTLPVDERALLDRLTELSAFERFLHRAYPGQTRFSIEGLGIMIPMLDELVARAAQAGTRTILLGMAHRGRLNVLAHVLGKPYKQIVAEFEGRAAALLAGSSVGAFEGWTGDVKYHAGASREVPVDDAPGESVRVVMLPNPSHLEYVNPVVEGMARAADEDRTQPGLPKQDEKASLAVLIHGDAAFPGQGVVAETLNLSRLAGFRTGGTVHIIANNQVGFTTSTADGRSTLYASDLAKGFEIPIIHVNADDALASLAAIRLAAAYRDTFSKDVLVDLVGYRRWGHNEGDEPSFTQPTMYAEVATHKTVREQFAEDLVARGVVAASEPDALLAAGLDEFQRIRASVRSHGQGQTLATVPVPTYTQSTNGAAEHAARPNFPPVSLEDLRELNQALLEFPADFAFNPKLDRAMQRRRSAFDAPAAPIDWGHAEALAFATLLRAGVPIRLSGQDARRGTFSQRHLTYYDARTGAPYTPLEHLPGARASFEVQNSPLSESAVLGFEYGYGVQAPESLVLWEAQYGDFVNSAQVIVDEFVVSGQAKWGLRSGLVLLLPHAWEGQGPDHSGARLERFLDLAAEDNLRVANCTTAAQYFHLLRQQAATLGTSPLPLVLMTPKSLLRHPLAAARASDLLDPAGFQAVLDDAQAAGDPNSVERVVLCSGKVWADAASSPLRATTPGLALARVEQIYPLPTDAIAALLRRYAQAKDIVWLQEEPANMGTWPFVQARLETALACAGGGRSLRYVGRPERASPAEGWSDVHILEQQRIIGAIFDQAVAHVR